MPSESSKARPETSPGGSAVLRYPREGHRPTGTEGELVPGARKDREAVYDGFFGSCETVYHEVRPQIPHIDVYAYRGGQKGREFCTLVTGGMSDLPMRLPPEAEGVRGVARRVELIFYCSEPKSEYLETLRWLAAFPHACKTWIGSGHTIPNGDPPAPVWGSAELYTLLLMPTIVRPDNALQKALSIAGDPVEFLWVVPLSQRSANSS